MTDAFGSSDRLDSPAAKVLAVLAAIARLGAAPVSALAHELRLPVPTAHRICLELERLGFVRRVPGTRQWMVARTFVDVAAQAIAAAARDAPTDAILRRLSQEIGEMCSFAIQVGDEVVYVASTAVPHAVTLSFHAGRRAPLFCTSSGRLFLAHLDDEALAAYLVGATLTSFTRHTTTSAKALMAEIRRVRRQGYAMTAQQFVPHVVGAAVPVEADDGTVLGALSVAAPDFRMSLATLRGALPALRRGARQLAGALRDAGSQDADTPKRPVRRAPAPRGEAPNRARAR
jgi:DNA-binding IclR family transcriptional regulator